jgi:hypothetical protein
MSGRHPRVSIAPQARSLRWAGKPSPKPRRGPGASRRGGERPQATCVEAAGGELPSRANPMGHGGPRSFAEAGAARGATDLPASHGAWKGDMNGDTKAIFRKETLFQSIQRTPLPLDPAAERWTRLLMRDAYVLILLASIASCSTSLANVSSMSSSESAASYSGS